MRRSRQQAAPADFSRARFRVTAGRLVASILERELDCGFIRLPHEGVPPEIKQSPFGPRRKRPELSMNCCTTTQKSSEGDGKYQSRDHNYLDSNGRSELVTPVFGAICGLFCTTLELRFRFMIPLKLGIFGRPF